VDACVVKQSLKVEEINPVVVTFFSFFLKKGFLILYAIWHYKAKFKSIGFILKGVTRII